MTMMYFFVAVLTVTTCVVNAQQPLYIITNGLCLTLGSDQQTVQLYGCGQYGNQLWDTSSGERLQMSGYCLDAFPGLNGGLQIKPCALNPSQTWWFGQDGKITNKAQPNGCLSTTGIQGATLYLGQCGPTSSSFSTSQFAPQQQQQQQQLRPPITTPGYSVTQQQSIYQPAQQLPMYQPAQQLPLQPPPLVQTPPLVQSQYPPATHSYPQQLPAFSQSPLQGLPPPLTQQPPPIQEQQLPLTTQIAQQAQQQQQTLPVSQQIQQQQQVQVDLSDDHYLCVCIVDASAESCNEAVRAACTVGHLDSHSCRLSFSSGDHDKIADEILKVIQNGAKCSQFDKKKLLSEAQKKPALLPKNAFKPSADGIPTTEDHYLCVCIDSQQSDKCLAAVKAACLVGHLPSGDCYASLSKNDHDGITDHIVKLIDSGAGCSQRYARAPTNQNNKQQQPGFFSRMIKGTPKGITKDNKDLCACLDDHESALCGTAIKRACSDGRIPKEDCHVAANNHYLGGVTKHALKLIDHGAECPAHRSMTFTNHGCHCLQSWQEGTGGKALTFPNNCADPGGKRGYAWCKTFPTEHCAGVDGSIEWDRCDNPKFPIRRDASVVDGNGETPEGTLGEEDHYLCICLSETSTDEVCVAAVKAACEVGHLPQAACKASFESNEHSAVSDMVVQLLKGGARCTETLSQQGIVRAKAGETSCPEGYFGFPNCRQKVECSKPCSHGATCDFSDGSCTCLPNFVGPTCSQCAEGFSGRNCVPDGTDEGWTLGQGLIYLFLFGGLVYAAFTAYKRFGGVAHGITYTKLTGRGGNYAPPESPEVGASDKGFPSHVDDDAITLSTDLGGDIESDPASMQTEKKSSPPPAVTAPKKHEHTGLAI